MSSRALALIVAAVAAGLACLAGPILLSQQAISMCPPAAAASGATGTVWDDEQLTNATTIVNVGVSLGVPERGQIIAVATAMQESSLRNLPHLGEDNDHDSLGLFQQRPSMGWGTPEQIMDPRYASTVFYERLLQVPGWQDLPLTEAAQQVQRSATPQAYAKWEDDATALVRRVGSANRLAIPEDLEQCLSNGDWTLPVNGPIVSGFRTAERPDHDGVDIAAQRGTPVCAAAAGTVVTATCNAHLPDGSPYSCDVDGSPSVLGCGWYLDLRHADGSVTRYCHLLTKPYVEEGDQVYVGQVVGLVGSSGNSSGPHLHLETHISYPATGNNAVEPTEFFAIRGVDLG